MRKIYIPAMVLMLVLVLVASSAQAYYGLNKQKDMSLSVFAAVDNQSDESGFGVSLTMYKRDVQDVTYVDFGDFRLFQTSTLSTKTIGGFPVHMGFVAGYANADDGVDAVDGFLTGLQVILARSKSSGGLSVDLRASTLTNNINPIKWFTDPDVLWAGAGVSYSF